MKKNYRAIAIIAAATTIAMMAAGCGAAPADKTVPEAPSVNLEAPIETEVVTEAPIETEVVTEAPAPAEVEATTEIAGIWADNLEEDADTLELTAVEDGTYTVVIGITRLCELTGTATVVDGTVQMTLTDPAEGQMEATFTEGTDGYDLTITNSTWSLLETGTVFNGFNPI